MASSRCSSRSNSVSSAAVCQLVEVVLCRVVAVASAAAAAAARRRRVWLPVAATLLTIFQPAPKFRRVIYAKTFSVVH